MNDMQFEVVQWTEVPGEEWLRFWSARYDANDLDKYRDLIDRAIRGSLSSEDYENIGRWKDDAYSDGRWKENVASVAYVVWKRIAEKKPPCPTDDGLREFLEKWSKEKYTDQYRSGARSKEFGLSRATTLLHFLSAGRYPIFDSRVQSAVSQMTSRRVENTVDWYVSQFLPLFQTIAARCGTSDGRLLDLALFAYGAFTLPDARKTR